MASVVVTLVGVDAMLLTGDVVPSSTGLSTTSLVLSSLAGAGLDLGPEAVLFLFCAEIGLDVFFLLRRLECEEPILMSSFVVVVVVVFFALLSFLLCFFESTTERTVPLDDRPSIALLLYFFEFSIGPASERHPWQE